MRRVILIAVALAVAGLALASRTTAAEACWKRVLADGADGRVAATYRLGCYRDALDRMPEDIRTYSSAAVDIERALLAATERKASRFSDVRISQAAARTDDPEAFPLPILVVGVAGLLLVGAAGTVLAVRRFHRQPLVPLRR